MTDDSTAAAELELRCEPDRKRHRVTVLSGGTVLHVDVFNVTAAAARAKFVSAVVGKYGGIDRDYLDAELMRLAATGPTVPTADALAEVDVRRVVRPELFHTPDVSGLTVSVVLAAGEKVIPRWRTHLRWADGRREVIDTPDRIDLPGCCSLYVHPDPGEPPGADPPAWSVESRRGWLDGADAPDPADVFKRTCAQIAYFLDFPPDSAAGTTATVALWAMFSYLYPCWPAVPYLYVGGPMGSGKSRVLDVLQRLAFRPTASSNMTAPALFRTLNAFGGTLVYDEAERLRSPTPDVAELQSVLLAGYKRGGAASRLEAVGDTFRPVRFDVYGPKVLACIAGLPPTLASRAIPITMFRAAGDSPKPGRLIDADPTGWQSIRDDLHVLALEYGPTWCELVDRRDVVPSAISGRNAELWQPLLALAHWLDRSGADGLFELVRAHAIASVASAKDDSVSEHDEILLELLAEAVKEGEAPTPGELLKQAKERDEVLFKIWHPATVSRRLKAYGIERPKKLNGSRRYRDVTPAALRQIQDRYGIDLGIEKI